LSTQSVERVLKDAFNYTFCNIAERCSDQVKYGAAVVFLRCEVCLCVYFMTFNPLTLTVDISATIRHPVPDRVKQSFVIFDIRALWPLGLSVRVLGCQKLQMTAPVWHRMLY